MSGTAWFVPGRPTASEGPLARYRPPQRKGVASAYVRHLTRPGDLVVDLFCQGPVLIRETVQEGRRALGFNINPVNLLVAGLGLAGPPDPTPVVAALAHLGDSPKGSVPLRQHILSLYHTRCPTCGAEGTAESFVWDGRVQHLYEKTVRCPRCPEPQQGPADEQDQESARRIERRGKLSYHLALERAIPKDHPARERTARLVDLYTPRNLSALMDVTLRLEGLELDLAVRRALQGALLSIFDRGSCLDPPEETRPRPRLLRLPSRFLERNVWLLLEEEVDRLLDWLGDASPPAQRAPDLDSLLSSNAPAYILLPSAAREVGSLLPSGSVSLILADPPRPDGVFWALCALWAGWLWGTPLADALRPFLARRRFDWEWHCRALRAALAAAGPLLTPEGYLILLFNEQNEGLMESSCLAAVGAGYELTGWGASAGEGTRLVWRWNGPPAPGEERRAGGLETASEALARACLQARAEPTPWPVIHSAILAGLAAHPSRLLALPADQKQPPLAAATHSVRQGLARIDLATVDEEQDLRWAKEAAGSPPLADRVEEIVRELLSSQSEWRLDDLLWALYARLDGPLTPDLSLVLMCLDSYSIVDQEGCYRLRTEDRPERRREEVLRLRADLEGMGRRLGFRVGRGAGWDVRWQEKGRRQEAGSKMQDVYLFLLSTTAVLGRYLLSGPAIPRDATPCLVFPGGRAELLAFKLDRDPRMGRAMKEGGWQLLKFRHLRRLTTEQVSRHIFTALLGLDPITKEGIQIPLELGGEL